MAIAVPRRKKEGVAIACFATVVLFNAAASMLAGADDSRLNSNELEQWRVPQHCGRNCVYITLRLLQTDVAYGDVQGELPERQEGHSLLELRQAASKFGVKMQIVKGPPEILTNCSLPVIAHWEEEEKVTGHYVVVIACTSEEVRYIDGTTAMIGTMPMVDFQTKWTGYLLIPEPSSDSRWVYATVIGTELLILFVVLWRWRSKRAPDSNNARSHSS